MLVRPLQIMKKNMLQSKMLQNIIELFTTAKFWFIKLLGLFLVWFEPARELSTMLIVLIVIDAITDLWVKIDAKEKINIKEFLLKQIKDITLMLIYILVIHYFQQGYLKETIAVFKLMVGIPLLAVIFGIIDNIEKLSGIPIGAKAKELLSSIFGKLTDKVTEKKDDEA
jgi:hypothetical protein